MDVLVTGASGFIGGHLVRALIADGHAVRALVRSPTGARVVEAAGARTVRGDVLDPASLVRAAAGCQVAYLLTAPRDRQAGVEVYERGAENVMRAALDRGLGRVIQAGTVGVYGRRTGLAPVAESAPLRPDSARRRGNAVSERVAERFRSQEGLPVVVARLTPMYGPGQLLWAPLFRAAAAGRATVVGSGRAPRHLTYVSDIVGGLRRLGEAPAPPPSLAYNVGAREAVPTLALIEAVAAEARVKLAMRRLPGPPLVAAAELARPLAKRLAPAARFVHSVELFTEPRVFDVSLARRELGFAASVSLGEGVARMLAWLRRQGYA